MNWIRRFAVPIGSALALLVCLQLTSLPARADSATYVFHNQPIAFTHISQNGGARMVGINDPGLRALLADIGAVVTWREGERYVLITTAEPTVINFSVGDKEYDVGILTAQASVAPYSGPNGEVYLPFNELLTSLDLAAKRDGASTILQPQLASVDIQGSGSQAILIARGGTPLHSRIVQDTSDRVVYAFNGVGSTLARSRSVDAGGIRSIEIATAGSVRDPQTTVTVLLSPGARHDAPQSRSGDFEVAFGGGEGPPPLTSVSQSQPVAGPPEPEATATAEGSAPVDGGAPNATSNVATVSGVTVAPSASGATVNISVAGNANFEWHHLREPDNRFWIDIKGATLQGGPRDEAESAPVTSLRVRQNDAQTVRVALSFANASSVDVSPSSTGVTITVGRDDTSENVARSGEGSIGSVVAVNEPQALVTPVPADMYGQNPPESGAWKFGARSGYVATNPKLIVIDPGHGGSDRGAIRNGTAEADLALDMSKRLRDLLVARGWQVRMTRNTDVDVYAPNDSAHDELQARVNVANDAGARMLISIHVNSFINSGPAGTTTYYSKPIDVPLAETLSRSLASSLGTKDDGTVRSHMYMTFHTIMPAVLIETAFLSNPSDYTRLTSPDWRQKVAQSIADGIDRYIANNPAPGNGGQ